jgi:hypothetical protein
MHAAPQTIEPALCPELLHDDVVLRRTVAGQHEVIAPERSLDEQATQLLMLVNGYTPLGALIDTCFPDADIRASVLTLTAHGLIEPVQQHVAWAWQERYETH